MWERFLGCLSEEVLGAFLSSGCRGKPCTILMKQCLFLALVKSWNKLKHIFIAAIMLNKSIYFNKLIIQNSHKILETKFHVFSMTKSATFHDHFCGQDSHNFSRNLLLDNFGNHHIHGYILKANSGNINDCPWPLTRLGSLQIFYKKFIAAQFCILLYLWLYFKRELG